MTIANCRAKIATAGLLATAVVGGLLETSSTASAQLAAVCQELAPTAVPAPPIPPPPIVTGIALTCNPLIVAPSLPTLGAMDTGPTGRVRHTNHDGLRESTTTLNVGSFEVDEASVYSNTAYLLPGNVLGGRLRLMGFSGYSDLTQRADTGQQKALIETTTFGGSAFWAFNTMFIGTQLAGFNSDVDSRTNGVRTSYDLDGYTGQTMVGNTYSLGNFSLLLTGAVLYSGYESSTFLLTGFNNATTRARIDVEMISGQIAGTLFTDIAIDGVGNMRPFMKFSYRGAFDQDISLRDATSRIDFEQATNFGLYEFGFDVTNGKFSYGASGYTEFSGDENTFGARISATYNFQ